MSLNIYERRFQFSFYDMFSDMLIIVWIQLGNKKEPEIQDMKYKIKIFMYIFKAINFLL